MFWMLRVNEEIKILIEHCVLLYYKFWNSFDKENRSLLWNWYEIADFRKKSFCWLSN